MATAVVGGLCLWQVVLANTGSASADSSSWVDGGATAVAQAISLAPSTAGLNYAFTLATSIADYQATEGQAEAETFNGTGNPLVLSATSDQCNGTAPTLKPSELPQPALAESANGDQSSSNNLTAQYGGASGPGVGAGAESASATTQPAADAVAKLQDFDVPGLFDISGVESSAYTQEVSGQLRQATDTVDISDISLANGAVEMKGLHWDDTQETGPGGDVTEQTSSFSLSGVSAGGVGIPPSVVSSLGQVLAIVNNALASSGLHVSMPVSSANSADGEEGISPLSIGIDQSALGRQAIGPALGASESVRDEIQNFLENDISCQTGIPLTFADVLIGTLAGGGNLDLELGGATAVTDGTAYANPFDNSLGLLGSGAGPVSALSATGSGVDGTAGSFIPGAAGTPGSPAVALGGAPSARTRTSGSTRRAIGVLSSVRCLTTSSSGRPGCSNGAALPVALIGLAVVLGVGAADYTRLRRFRRLTPATGTSERASAGATANSEGARPR